MIFILLGWGCVAYLFSLLVIITFLHSSVRRQQRNATVDETADAIVDLILARPRLHSYMLPFFLLIHWMRGGNRIG